MEVFQRGPDMNCSTKSYFHFYLSPHLPPALPSCFWVSALLPCPARTASRTCYDPIIYITTTCNKCSLICPLLKSSSMDKPTSKSSDIVLLLSTEIRTVLWDLRHFFLDGLGLFMDIFYSVSCIDLIIESKCCSFK